MRVWIDTDMGFDDLVSVGFCLAEGVDVVGISVVAGNVPLDRAVTNACAAAEVFGWQMPIHAGADAPLSGALQTAQYVLGPDGMRSAGARLPDPSCDPASTDAVTAIAAYLARGDTRILALGPLTNLARLAQTRPDLLARSEIVWMGGAFARGNHTAVAEYNAAADPEALDCVLRSGADFTMVGLECCGAVRVGLDDLAALRAMPEGRARLLADLYEGYIRIAADGARPMALYDPVAAAIMIEPGLAQLQQVNLAAELDGTHTRGMTVVEWRQGRATPNARVAFDPDANAIRARFHAALEQMAGAPQ